MNQSTYETKWQTLLHRILIMGQVTLLFMKQGALPTGLTITITIKSLGLSHHLTHPLNLRAQDWAKTCMLWIIMYRQATRRSAKRRPHQRISNFTIWKTLLFKTTPDLLLKLNPPSDRVMTLAPPPQLTCQAVYCQLCRRRPELSPLLSETKTIAIWKKAIKAISTRKMKFT